MHCFFSQQAQTLFCYYRDCATFGQGCSPAHTLEHEANRQPLAWCFQWALEHPGMGSNSPSFRY